MFKSYIFASLYTVVGVGGWGAYSTISSEDTSLSTMKQIAVQAITIEETVPKSKSLYRWKDHEGNWQYGQVPVSDIDNINNTYKKELEMLRSLPREALPTNALVATKKDNGIMASLSSFSNLGNLGDLFSSGDSAETDSKPQLTKLLDEAKKIKQTAKEREEFIHNIGK